MASDFGWSRWVGDRGTTVCMTSFGASAPLAALQKKFLFTVDNVIQTAHRVSSGMRQKSKASS
jgi:transketolase